MSHFLFVLAPPVLFEFSATLVRPGMLAQRGATCRALLPSSWVQRLSLVAFGATAASSPGAQTEVFSGRGADEKLVRGLPGSPANITYLAMMPGAHGKPGLQNIGNVTIAFSDWRLRRSVDGGRSFGPVLELPDKTAAKCLNPDDGVMLADEVTQTLFYLVACDDHTTTGRSSSLAVLNSTDAGLTWATPAMDITSTTRLSPQGTGAVAVSEGYIPAIGGGIQLSSGRLVAQMYGKWCFDDPSGNCNTSGAFSRHGESPTGWAEINHVIFSADHGETWGTSPVFGVYGGEGEVVELYDGHGLMFNYRVDGPMVDHCPDGARICDTGYTGWNISGGNITMACGQPPTAGRVAPHHCRGVMFSSDEGSSWHDGQSGDGWFGSTIPDLPDPGCKGGKYNRQSSLSSCLLHVCGSWIDVK